MDEEAIAREETEMKKGMATYKPSHPNGDNGDIVEEMMAENGADSRED